MEHILERDIVLFLGAGFSCNVGLPKMDDFGTKAKLDHDGLVKHKYPGPNYRYAAPLLTSSAETFEGFQNLLFQRNVLKKDEINNMETLFCIAESLNESGIKELEINGNPKSVENLIVEIQLWLWKIYQQYPPSNAKRKYGVDEKILTDFFEIIKKAKIHNKVTVLTTNYDLVYEYCAWKSGNPCAYPFSWDKDFKAGHNDKHFIFQKVDCEGKTLVCKLHGSINYFQNTKQSEDELFISSDLSDNRTIGKSKIKSDLPALFAVDSIWNIRNRYGNGYTPTIIPPSYAKLRGYPWLRKIWQVAFEAITKSKKIIFIGYSFPESDGFIRAFFQGAFAMRENNLDLVIHVIDPCPKTHEKYKKFFKSKYGKPEPLSLKDAINKGIMESLF